LEENSGGTLKRPREHREPVVIVEVAGLTSGKSSAKPLETM